MEGKSLADDLKRSFDDAYASLNEAQRTAVDAIEGPVMVIAGPGTGKTQILTLRIANILLKTDTAPESILALTFTDAGVKAMRERLHRYIGARSYRVSINTFHGFCTRLISLYPDAYARIIGGRPANDIERFDVLRSILDTPQIKKLRPMNNPTYYVQSIISIIGELKKEYITPDTFAEIIAGQEEELGSIEQYHLKGAHKGKVRSEYTKKEESIIKNRELLYVYRQYESALASQKLFDYEDMILQTIDALSSNENMLRDLQETYQYILADEHQDVNGSQNKILELLCGFHTRPNLFVVGDEKQAIYRFQGASLENFLYFEDAYEGTQTIALTQNYRSGQQILDAAHDLVAVEEGPLRDLRLRLDSAVNTKSDLQIASFSHQAVEDAWVVSQVETLIASGVQRDEIAVIVRTNREVESLTALLRKSAIAAEASSESDILEHPITRSVLTLLQSVVNLDHEEALREALHGAYWGISSNDLFRILSNRSHSRTLHQLIRSESTLIELGLEAPESVLRVGRVLDEAHSRDLTQQAHRVVEYLLQESGLLEHVLRIDPYEGGRVIRRIYDEIERTVVQEHKSDLSSVCRLFALHQEHGIPLLAPFIPGAHETVRVLTAHKSKGLEFEAVLIPHVHDGLWGGKKRREMFKIPFARRIKEEELDPLDDERRLLYVALTRAKSKLYLSYAALSSEGVSQLRSRLCDDIDGELLPPSNTEAFESAFDPMQAIAQKLPKHSIDSSLLAGHLSSRGLSPTALNNYLQSPYDYLYRNVLRVPEMQSPSLQFGTAIHNVMEWYSAYFTKEHVAPSATQLKDALSYELGRLPIDDAQFARMHEKGYEALIAYAAHAEKAMPEHAKVEMSLRAVLPTGIAEFPEVLLTGKLDRLDLDFSGNILQVVDYKTGRPKTRNEIEGKTKNGNGNYKRQLVFYALLLSLYEDARYECRDCVLSFIEPDKNGVIHEEHFSITNEEIEALKAQIIQVVGEICTGSFLAQPCDPQNSSYCHLADQLDRS